MKKICKHIVILYVILMLGLTTIVYAENEENKNIIEKTEEFSNWENLDENEKKSAIQPVYFDINIKDSMKRSSYNTYLSSEESLEKRFNLKEQINNIIVKNQRKTGSCWAFAYTSVIETTIANKYKKESTEYSPIHMEYIASKTYNKKIGEGGNNIFALSYSASGYGPVYETDFPIDSVYSEANNSQEQYYLSDIDSVQLDQTARARIEDATIFAPIYKTYSEDTITYKNSSIISTTTKYTDEEVTAIRTKIKEHIKENGAVTAVMYSDMGTNAGNQENSGTYYNPETKAYYCNKYLKIANHSVTIVGWDDNYSKDNFSEGNKPLNDGAYIVLNSWGEGFGDKGYFYVSYDDAFIERDICGITQISEETEDQKTYDNIYEYDELGMNYGIYSLNDDKTEYLTSGYGANVFERKNTEKTEYLTEVGIFLMTAEGVEVYVNQKNDDLADCTLVATSTGTNALESGYHTLKLASPVELTGEKFVVKIKYINSEKVVVPIECNLLDSGLTTSSNTYDTATSNIGESFFSNDGAKWKDLYGYIVDDKYTLKNTNICIKAFSTLSESQPTTPDENDDPNKEEITEIKVTNIALNTTTLSMQVGEKTNLSATIEPINATNKNVIWTSSNETVATISENGIIEAISTGKTTITAETEDGGIKATCEIDVSEKTNSEDDIYTEKEQTPGVIEESKIQDTTVAKQDLPKTGIKTITIVVTISIIIAIIIYRRYKKYEDIK